MHFLLAAATAATEWTVPGCAGSSHWFCQTHESLQGLNPSHLVFMAIPFWVTVLVVSKLAIQPLLKVAEEREARTDGARAEAAELEAKFNERLQAYESRLAETRQRAADERAEIRASATAEAEKILGAARDEAAKAVEKVRLEVESERTKARAELAKQAETLAAELAGKALGREIAPGTASSRGPAARTEARS